jgi:hypothetical protein
MTTQGQRRSPMRKFLILTAAAPFCLVAAGMCDQANAKGKGGGTAGNVVAKWDVGKGAVAKSTNTKIFRATSDKYESRSENRK